MKECFNNHEVEVMDVDDSVGYYDELLRRPLTLERCLDAYTEEEKIPEVRFSEKAIRN